jgi:GTP pyrophosphokinase
MHRKRVRDRISRRIAAPPSRTAVKPVLEPLFAIHRSAHPKADVRKLQRGYEVAEQCHRGQLRKSGDPYITHPLAVATILAELGMDTTTLIAALLHDTVEDTGYTDADVAKEFGAEVAHLVDGVTKLDKVKFGEAAEAETIRKMIVAMSRDPRVLVIKLADRLHNMRTLRFLPPAKQERKARETLEVLAPLAHRLGMNTLKWELEDLSFATLYPKRYDEIVRLVAERAPSRDTYLGEVIEKVNTDLKEAGIKAEITGRPKHYYSIYQKMIVRGRDFTDIYDLVGIRVLVESERDCYAALGAIHANWQPVPGRFKDYIAAPKFNMYQSLHTTVIGPGGKPVELQIRTHAMHRTAEYGIAAHWKYKDTKNAAVAEPSGMADEMGWLRQLLDWQREAQEPEEFLDSLRYDLAGNEVYAFTPKGDVIALPAGSTPVDFAYAVHTEVGHRCIGARVNGKLVALESTLDNGDTVEVFTSKAEGAGPSRDWLAFVKSPRARTKIRQWFAKERREDAIEAGKIALSKAMRKSGLPMQRLLGGDQLLTLAQDLHLADISALYAAIGESPARRCRGFDRGRLRDDHPGHRRPLRDPPGRRRRRCRGQGRDGRAGQARPLLHSGSRRRHPRIRHPRRGSLGAPPLVHQRDLAARATRTARGSRVGAVGQRHVRRLDPGRGAGPARPALGRHARPVGRAGLDPVGPGLHQPRPRRRQPLHLRDGRGQAPRAPATHHPQRRRRLRRLPRLRQLARRP